MGYFLFLVVLLSGPAFAANYTPWDGHDSAPLATRLSVEFAQKGGDSCCKHCTKGQPCGNSCISASAKCKQPPGCAC